LLGLLYPKTYKPPAFYNELASYYFYYGFGGSY
jgi:hypothetical protein